MMGIIGRSGSGKTTLIARLIPALCARGYRVSTLKHAHHGFDIDRPGKDSFIHRSAGAFEVMLISNQRWVLMHEQDAEQKFDLRELIGRLAPVDFVLVEGFHALVPQSIEVYRPAIGKDALFPSQPGIIAVASEDPMIFPGSIRSLSLQDIDAIAEMVINEARAL